MQSVCLALIVKNAADTVGRCVASALPLVDRWLIIDTGSTDDTKAVVRAALEGVQGELVESEWVDFAHNRSELLSLASRSGAEYVLMLDADMEIVVERLPENLTHDELHISLSDRGLVYDLPLLTRASKPFFYAGVAHACLNCPEPVSIGRLEGVRIVDHGGGPGKDGKFERDLANLSADVLKKPNDPRSWFYLAQTYKDLDKVEEAIEAYKHRASMPGGNAEEVYWSLYQVGILLCEHVDFGQGADWLMRAWKHTPTRAEALRALAGVTTYVANKIPFPAGSQLFVDAGAHTPYSMPRPAPVASVPVGLDVEFSSFDLAVITPEKLRRRPRATARKGLDPRDVSAVIVTRGNVDLAPVLESLPYDDIVVWDNSREVNYKVFGRYAAIPRTRNPVIYWQDDDVVFTEHAELLKAYEPGKLVTNMDDPWIDACHYRDLVGMQGAGSLCDAGIPAEVFARYLAVHPFDDDFLTEADFAFGVLVPFKVVDLGFEARPFADDADRLYTQPWQPEKKWAMIKRARRILLEEQRSLGADGWCGCDEWLVPAEIPPYPACPHDGRGAPGVTGQRGEIGSPGLSLVEDAA